MDTEGAPDEASAIKPRGSTLTVEALYEEHFAFVWRSARRLGVPMDCLDDAVQDVFLAAHRRLNEFEGRSNVKTWLFGILINVARVFRRSTRRRHNAMEAFASSVSPEQRRVENDTPFEAAKRAQAAKILHAALETLDDDKRAALVMADFEDMSASEIATTLGANVNTIYSRIRSAREQFERAVEVARGEVES